MEANLSGEEFCYAYEVVLDIAASEAVEYGLMEAGASGTWTVSTLADMCRIFGYFNETRPYEEVEAHLAEALRIYNFGADVIKLRSWRTMLQRDWLAKWKESWQPMTIGERFVVAAPWSEVANDDGARHVIRIEPGMAFGTGTHETTRLCLLAIERHFYGGHGATFLDVGTGTGILAIAAAKLHPEAIINACDTDAAAVDIAGENARLNNVAANITFTVGSVDEGTASADFICANLTADVILSLLPTLINLTCGHLVLSGILATQADAVRRRLDELGATNYETLADGEWIALVV